MVESTALEMRHTRKGIAGSNPALSAITHGMLLKNSIFSLCPHATQSATHTSSQGRMHPCIKAKCTSRIRGVSTRCMAMSGSGPRTAGTTATPATLAMVAREQRRPGTCTQRVVRGGSWDNLQRLRSANRWKDADYRFYIFGFRVAGTLNL